MKFKGLYKVETYDGIEYFNDEIKAKIAYINSVHASFYVWNSIDKQYDLLKIK